MTPLEITLLVIDAVTIGTAGYWYNLVNKREKQLHKLAYYDSLTGLSNRVRFNQHATKVIESKSKKKAVILIDIDAFKSVNDTHGHEVGDQYLKTIANKIDRLAKEQNNGSFATRLGGDEFVVVLENASRDKHVVFVNELYEQLHEPIVVNADKQAVVEPRISVGISLYPKDGTNISQLLKAADLALYHAKDSGKNTFSFHEKTMSTRFERMFEYQMVIKNFVDNGDFDLRFQPIVDTKSGKIKGAEVLLGFDRDKYGNINVEELIKIAEGNGDIIPLGENILRKACEYYVSKFAPVYDNSEFILSVNLSAKQLDDPEFSEKVLAIIEETKIDPKKLELEITETAIMKKFQAATTAMETLMKVGVRFSIDDFGKGYSSMSQLRRLNVNKIKIDGSFVDDIEEDKKSYEIIKAFVLISETLGLQCVAEGVEDSQQYRKLRALGCDLIQGYLISPPLNADQFIEFKWVKPKKEKEPLT